MLVVGLLVIIYLLVLFLQIEDQLGLDLFTILCLHFSIFTRCTKNWWKRGFPAQTY